MQLLFFQVSYSLTQLAKTQLNKDRKEITPRDIPRMLQTSESLMELVGSNYYFNYFFWLLCLIINQDRALLFPWQKE